MGGLSAALLIDAGINRTLIGLSERRVGFGFPGEASDVVNFLGTIRTGKKIILCIVRNEKSVMLVSQWMFTLPNSLLSLRFKAQRCGSM